MTYSAQRSDRAHATSSLKSSIRKGTDPRNKSVSFASKPKAVTPEERANNLPQMIQAIRTHGVMPDSATELFAFQGKCSYAINRDCLVPMSSEGFQWDMIEDRATFKAFQEAAELLRHDFNPLSISTGEAPFFNPANPLKFNARDADMYQRLYSQDSDAKNAHLKAHKVGKRVYNDAQVLSLYLGGELIGSASASAWFQYFINRGEKPTQLKDPSFAKEGETDKRVPTTETAKSWYDYHRQQFCEGMGRTFLLYPVPVEPFVNQETGAPYAKGEINQAFHEKRAPVPLTLKDDEAPSLVCFYALDESEEPVPHPASGAHEKRRLHFLEPALVKKAKDFVAQFAAEADFPALANLSQKRTTAKLDLSLLRKKAIAAHRPPPCELDEYGKFDAKWCAERLALMWGHVWIEALGDQVVGGVMQPVLVADKKVLKPLTKDGVEAMSGVIWRDARSIGNEAYKEEVLAMLDMLMARKGASKASGRGGCGGAGGGAGAGGGGGDSVRARKEKEDLETRLLQESEKLKGAEAELANAKVEIERLKEVARSAVDSASRFEVGGSNPHNVVVFFHNEIARMAIKRASSDATFTISQVGSKDKLHVQGSQDLVLVQHPAEEMEEDCDPPLPLTHVPNTFKPATATAATAAAAATALYAMC